ncbi:U-box domain-containing protein 4 [Spatholobus suberectus]|nr:U-box domain-containing protein 4 [Spatholobus suberectus]
MLKLIESSSDSSVSEAIDENFLGLSALDSNKLIIGSSNAISFLSCQIGHPGLAQPVWRAKRQKWAELARTNFLMGHVFSSLA